MSFKEDLKGNVLKLQSVVDIGNLMSEKVLDSITMFKRYVARHLNR